MTQKTATCSECKRIFKVKQDNPDYNKFQVYGANNNLIINSWVCNKCLNNQDKSKEK